MTAGLFAYGTLEAPEVVERVLGRRLPGVPARLDGFVRYRVRGRPYPGIVERPGDHVDGTLLRGIEPHHLERLDVFEGPLYERRLLTVRIEHTHGVQTAFVYVIPSERAHVLGREPWSRDRFLSGDRTGWLRGTD